MLKNLEIVIGHTKYIINGLDAISSLTLLPVFQRVANTFVNMSSGGRERVNPDETREDLEFLLFKSGVLREVYDKSANGNPMARDVKHHSQLPSDIGKIGDLIGEIGRHLFDYDAPNDSEKKT